MRTLSAIQKQSKAKSFQANPAKLQFLVLELRRNQSETQNYNCCKKAVKYTTAMLTMNSRHYHSHQIKRTVSMDKDIECQTVSWVKRTILGELRPYIE